MRIRRLRTIDGNSTASGSDRVPEYGTESGSDRVRSTVPRAVATGKCTLDGSVIRDGLDRKVSRFEGTQPGRLRYKLCQSSCH